MNIDDVFLMLLLTVKDDHVLKINMGEMHNWIPVLNIVLHTAAIV